MSRPSPSKTLAAEARSLDYCSYCPKLCRHVCPVAAGSAKETHIPQAKMHLLNMVRRDAISLTGETSDPLYACTSCRLCLEHCRHEINVATVLEQGRALAVKSGCEHPALSELPERFRRRNLSLQRRLHELLPEDRFATSAPVGYLPGCDTIEHTPEALLATLSLFDQLQLDYVKVVDSPVQCAGYPLWASGHRAAARRAGEEMVRQIRRFPTLVVGCAACAHLLRERLAEEGIEHNTEVLHVTELLAPHAERLPIRRKRPVAHYHDPCYLGRYLGIYEPPRTLARRAVEDLKEFFHNKNLAACCGGGGLVAETFPEAAARQAAQRLAEARLYGSDLVLTSCATCVQTLSEAAEGVEVIDLIQLLAWATRDD